jgi:phosphatidylinositol alpha-mannosyltransferase
LIRQFEVAGGRIRRVGHTRTIIWNGRTVTTVGEPGLGRDLSRIDPKEFDLVHVHAPFEPFLPFACVQYFRSPIVGTFHTVGTGRGLRFFRPWLLPVARRLTARIAVSEAARRFVAPDYPGAYHILPNGIDLSRFSPGPSVRRAGELRVLSVGRLDPRKGVDVLLRALSTTRVAGTLRVRIVGSGPERKDLETYARARRLPVDFCGVVSEAELVRALSWADVFVAPATFGESFGIVLLEAMAAGLPILASDIEGYRELTGPCAGVELVRPGDPGDWAKRLGRLASDPERRGKMGAANLDFAEEYSWPKIVDQLERIYERIGVGSERGSGETTSWATSPSKR